MNPIFTFVVITLGILAIFDIIVGVANDAVNFLNSAIGSKIASMKVILSVASVGILVGTLTSSGMMDVARSGVFHPDQFTFAEIMMLFLGMIIGDILLLDIFNNLGLPTSTTVSMVFGLLGSAVGVALHRIASSDDFDMSHLSTFINGDKALAIISAILLSVVLSFLFGLLFMYISRLIFSFRYKSIFSKLGAFWCGISFVGIVYFSLFKGLKNTGFIPKELTTYINENLVVSLLVIWIAASILLFILQKLFKANILKITILTGTFALALAFAGNDLVNFIGVPLAGLDSYKIAMETGDMSMKMTALLEPAKANIWILSGAGLIMVLTLVFSKKAMHVADTELSLASQNETTEQFGASVFSRALVHGAISINNAYKAVTPAPIQRAISSRFEPLTAEERGDSIYDLIRATVNLSAASILISIATSLKLPLSTTYVVFMVAMGSSLADKAWGRESAVYRITGVIAVVMGWFMTAFAGFTLALCISLTLMYGGNIAVIVVAIVCFCVAARSNFFPSKKKSKAVIDSKIDLDKMKDSEELLFNCTKDVLDITEETISIYNRTLVALFKENRKILKEMDTEAAELYECARKRKYNLMDILHKLESSDIDSGHFYVQVVDYINEVTKTLVHITRPSLEHINNHHQGLSREQIQDLMSVNNDVENIFTMINQMLSSKDFSNIDKVMELRDAIFDKIADAIKSQLRRIKADPEHSSTRANMLYLNLLTETKTMILQGRNLIKSQKYFINNSVKK